LKCRPITQRTLSFTLAVVGGLALSASPARADYLYITNSTPISIPKLGEATPYPSSIVVARLGGTVTDVNVTIHGISHTFPIDIGAILVGPQGQVTFLFDGPDSGIDIKDLTWTFDDAAAGPLPQSIALVSGTFQPNSYYPADVFPAPALAPPYAQSLGIFNGTDPNGYRRFRNKHWPERLYGPRWQVETHNSMHMRLLGFAPLRRFPVSLSA
jgi:hypothetical protein